jgi:predicted AlkP superfamily phosphohydrolase/phosphomutase
MPAKKVLVVALDGATLDLIRPWAEQGHLPHLANLMRAGAVAPLESTMPPVTSPAWPTFMTGKNPGKHGVFDFIRPGMGSFSMVNASQIAARTLWELLSDAGKRVIVLNVPITHPPRAVNGVLVPGLLSPDQGHTTHPAGLLARYEPEIGPYRVTPQVQYRPGNEDAFIAELRAFVDLHARLALRLMRDEPWDFCMVHFLATDNASHALWRFMDATHPRYEPALAARYGHALRDVYARCDAALGELIAAAPPDTDVLVMSDHGFGPLHWTVNLNLLFLERGLLQLKRDPWTRLRAWAFRRGLTPAAVYQALARLGVQDITARVSRQTRNAVVGKFLSFEDVDWARTRAYSMGHVGQVYLLDPSARDEVVAALQSLREPGSGRALFERVIPREEAAHGPYAAQGADLHVVLDGYNAIAFPLFAADGRVVTRQIRGDSGCHRLHGVLIAAGPDVAPGAAVAGARLIDLAPPSLHLFGLPVPADMDGRVLTELLSGAQAVAVAGAGEYRGRQEDFSAEEQAEVEARLRDLGYLG